MIFVRNKKNTADMVSDQDDHIYVISQRTVYMLTVINKKTQQSYPVVQFLSFNDAKENAEKIKEMMKKEV